MSGLSELGQVLHEEHFRILVSICELQNRISGESANRPLDSSEAEDGRLLTSLLATLDQVIVHHSFEETVIFPLIYDSGEGDLAKLLTREHGAIEPKARTLRMIAHGLIGRRADMTEWEEFCAAAADLVAEVMRHLEKEEITVVQRLPSFLDAATDHQLAQRHIAEDRAKLTVHNLNQDRRTQRSVARTAAAQAGAAARAAARRRSTMPPRAGL